MMRQLPADKYNIAWFKLAEFVVRGEKERALALYRLLVHSLKDDALAYQLEGDLLLSFSDPKAIDAYQKAARAYHENNKKTQAAAIYEHIISLQPGCIGVLKLLIEVYRQLGNEHKLCYGARLLIREYIKDDKLSEVDALLAELGSMSDSMQAYLYEELIITYGGLPSHKRSLPQGRVMSYIENALDYGIIGHDQDFVQRFLTKLEMMSPEYYLKAQSYLKK